MQNQFKIISLFNILLAIGYLFLSAVDIKASTDINTVKFSLKYRALYVTCGDLDGKGQKDIIAADDYNITILKHKKNFSFETFTIKSDNKINALNVCRIDKTGREIIICIGTNSLFYFLLNEKNQIKGPIYIDIPREAIFLEKQRNIRNFLFVLDLNNDALDDLVIPCKDGILFFWQIKPLVFKTSFLYLPDVLKNIFLNIRPWPKFGKETPGFSFFLNLTKNYNYWLQDYNHDGLIDIILLSESEVGPKMHVLLQNKDNTFQSPRYIDYSPKSIGEELSLLDLNNDGFLDIVSTDIEYPLQGNNSFLPILIIKIFFSKDMFIVNKQADAVFKTVFIPGLENILDIDNDTYYEIIISSPPIKIGEKDSIIKVVTKKEVSFKFRYFKFNKIKMTYVENLELNKDFNIILPELDEIDSFKQFIRFEDINGDGIKDIIALKKQNLLEITLLKKNKEKLVVETSIDLLLPCFMPEIKAIDINSDKRKEFLILDSSGRNIYLIYIK